MKDDLTASTTFVFFKNKLSVLVQSFVTVLPKNINSKTWFIIQNNMFCGVRGHELIWNFSFSLQ